MASQCEWRGCTHPQGHSGFHSNDPTQSGTQPLARPAAPTATETKTRQPLSPEAVREATEYRGVSGNLHEGDKYLEAKAAGGGFIRAAEIAKEIRNEVKMMKNAGLIPADTAIAVRSQSYTGGQAVSITAYPVGSPDGPYSGESLMVPNPSKYAKDGSLIGPSYLPDKVCRQDVSGVVAALVELGHRYTRSDVDAQSDYFDVSCYINGYLSGSPGHGGLSIGRHR